ncbi:hypothetical protein PPSIR1_27938 [Plesiocystis pacifica SIR-1]|uniref:O-antigen ligase-related domain-containing protein n=1 Tax=Plesiocystis pacifica SIR-1 TaxID=391625 RepID=A6FZL0_9BACT|nr:O-antigen ligase family protein [Plesiocystis pacifica]EDM80816.1 hypothetical protein PPSIR1_27938 [Plesiocystis pacifica SIR-1]
MSALRAEHLAGVALALYLLSGTWSVDRILAVEPSIAWQPRTWAVAALLVLAFRPGSGSRRGGGVRPPSPTLFAAELGWLGLSLVALAWAPELELGTRAAIDLALMIAVAVALRRLLVHGRVDALLQGFELALLGLLGLLAAAAVAGGLGSGRLATLGGGPNVFGRNMGLLCVFSFERALRSPSSTTPRRASALWPLLAVFAAMLIALSGSRGAMISTAVALFALLALGHARPSRRLLVLAGAVILGLAAVTFTELGAKVAESFATRVLDLLLRDRYVSSRDEIYAIALEQGARRPVLGHGLASFAANTLWPYAHNMILDAWYETGALGVACLGLYLSLWGRGAWASWRCPPARQPGLAGLDALRAAALLILVASQFSGGRYDLRGLLVFAALTCLRPAASSPWRRPSP